MTQHISSYTTLETLVSPLKNLAFVVVVVKKLVSEFENKNLVKGDNYSNNNNG